MSLWKIAWRSIQQRALASSLTAISMALGVALVVAVLVIQGVVYQSFHRGGEGYDLIVGATKGSRLELVLASVYYIGQPVDNIPYGYYKKLTGEDPNNDGLSDNVELAIPICLGDNYEGYRVVGTLPDMFDRLHYLGDQDYRFAQGRNFIAGKEGYYEGVIGATVAKRTGLKVGDTFRPTHDVAGQSQHKHRPFTVVGILEPTGTPNDRGLFVNIEGFYRVGDHAKRGFSPSAAAPEEPKKVEKEPKKVAEESKKAVAVAAGEPSKKADSKKAEGEKPEADDDDHDEHEHADIPEDHKRVTAVLICSDSRKLDAARVLARQINQGSDAQAAIPSVEIAGLFENIVGNVEVVLLVFAVMIVLVAGIGIMVSIYNSMSDRRHEIAIMRALGANRTIIMLVILLESILLSLGGGLLGLALGHGVVAAAGPMIAEQTGVNVGLLQFRTLELVLIPGLLALASVVGYLPALAAYKTDVARSLIANP